MPEFRRRSQLALSIAGPGKRVLDLGCGDGVFTSLMAEVGSHVTGADISSEALARARRREGDTEYVEVPLGGALPFDDQSFDAVLCSEVCGQVIDTQSFFSEVRRVLRSNGSLALTTPYHGRLLNVWIALTGFERHYSPFGSQLRFYTKRSLHHLLHTFGFENADIWTVGGVPTAREMIFATAKKT